MYFLYVLNHFHRYLVECSISEVLEVLIKRHNSIIISHPLIQYASVLTSTASWIEELACLDDTLVRRNMLRLGSSESAAKDEDAEGGLLGSASKPPSSSPS
jgi:hypothetical protein